MIDLLIVLASQDFEGANHRGLWEELAKHIDVLVVNIPADYITSTLTRKTYRIKEAKAGIKRLSGRLSVFRPLLPLRPEAAPDWLFPWIAKSFWRQVTAFFPDIDSRRICVLAYDGRWIKVLNGSKVGLRFGYYLFDEVRNNGNDGSVDDVRTRFDDYACTHADFILTMTKLLADSRSTYTTKKIVIGNGADIPGSVEYKSFHIPGSIAFIGNIRDWIDTVLLTELIQLQPERLFAFVGPVEENMKAYLETLLDRYPNTAYFGKVPKERIPQVYRMFDAVIIPYKDNTFIRATRPIKIVESILAGTPVVSVPVDGYEESAFIRFAKDAQSFSRELDYIMKHRVIDENMESYRSFVAENTWQKKAKVILNAFEECRVNR